jgi:hypothetical protein
VNRLALILFFHKHGLILLTVSELQAGKPLSASDSALKQEIDSAKQP